MRQLVIYINQAAVQPHDEGNVKENFLQEIRELKLESVKNVSWLALVAMQRVDIVNDTRNNLNGRRPTANHSDFFIFQIDSVIPLGSVECRSGECFQFVRNIRNTEGPWCHDSIMTRDIVTII